MAAMCIRNIRLSPRQQSPLTRPVVASGTARGNRHSTKKNRRERSRRQWIKSSLSARIERLVFSASVTASQRRTGTGAPIARNRFSG